MTVRLDPHQPIFSQRDVTQCTGIGKGALDSYIINEHVRPFSIGGRRAFSVAQIVEIEIIHRLAALFKIPPHVGSGLARDLVSGMPKDMLKLDASAARDDVSWTEEESYRGSVSVEPVDGAAIELIVPVQRYARRILGRARAILDSGQA